MANRSTKALPVNMTPAEIAALDAHALSLGVTRHALMLACIRRAATVVLSLEDLTDVERRRARERKPSV